MLKMSQLYEQHINYISSVIRYRLEGMTNIKDKEDLLFSYLADMEPTSHRHYKAVYDSIKSDKERNKFFNEIIEYGLPILQLPFYGNITKDRLFHILEKYEISEIEVDTTTRGVIMGDMYHLR